MAVRGLAPIFQRQEPQGSLGQELGAGLGQGLQSLALQRLQDVAQRSLQQRQAAGLQSILPQLTPDQAQALGGLDQKTLDTVIKQIGQQGQLAGVQQGLAGLGIGEQVPEPSQAQGVQLGAPSLTPQQQLKLAEIQQKQVADAFKQTEKARTGITDLERATRDDLERVRIMDRLGPKLNAPAVSRALTSLGLDWMLSPESQEFQKLRNDFVVNARALFGGRPPQGLVERYLQSIPSLMQSKEGRERVIRTFQHMRQGALLRGKAMRDIIKDRGFPPFDINERIEERVQPQLEQLSNKFIEAMGGDATATVQLTPDSVGQTMNVDPKNLPAGTRFRSGGVEYRVVQKKGKKEIEKV